jgi:hypothetical protein
LTRDDALADISFLEHVLEDRFAYLDVGSTDHRVLFEDLRLGLPAELETSRLGLRLQKLMARFIDGHAAVNAPPHPRSFLPFLTGWTGDTLVAFEADRSALLDAERPYLVAIDGVDVTSWLTAAAAYVPAGSPQFAKRDSLRWLRAVQMLRADLGLPQVEDVAVTVAGTGGAYKRTLRLAVADRAPQFGTWPRGESRTLDGSVGYLRLETMTSEAAEELPGSMARFARTDGLVIDVRGNGGGSREALRALVPLLMRPQAEPRVANVAAYRAWEGFPADHLASRYLFPVASDHWSAPEREALELFMVGFMPEWSPPAERFSPWHAMVVSPGQADERSRYLGRPVVVLMDAACFSATDVFLSTLKGLPNVTLMGEASGGGSARAQVVELPTSGLKVRFASMASFQASGELFDGRGVLPDVVATPAHEFFLVGGADAVLEKGLEVVAGAA